MTTPTLNFPYRAFCTLRPCLASTPDPQMTPRVKLSQFRERNFLLAVAIAAAGS